MVSASKVCVGVALYLYTQCSKYNGSIIMNSVCKCYCCVQEVSFSI